MAQDVATLGAEASVKQEQSKSGKKTVVFRFVRMEATVRDDPRLGRTPGRILRILDEVDTSCGLLMPRYELLVAQGQDAAEQLQVARELLKSRS